MGRMHAPGKGLSQLVLPYCHSVPTWLKLTSDDVKEQIYKLAKKGLTPSQIGVILRDSHRNNILRLLKSKGLAPDLPEDLYHLIKKAVAVQKHPESSRKNKDRAGFTTWFDTIRPSEFSLPVGNMNHLQPLPWSHIFV
uniref:Small ribosomal subunit protein uS15 N-terminal domain-containing protein n=1 Tax=Rhinopithecus bieti TaxID=61621 RepID=A0A2K6K052_RHIBE